MDRLNKVHRASRVSLPKSVVDYAHTESAELPPRLLFPTLSRYAGVFGFVTGGVAVIVIASLLALSIQ